MPKKGKPGQKVMEALGWLAGPEYAARDLPGFFKSHERTERDSCELPLMALSHLAAGELQKADNTDGYGGIPPLKEVQVPWWVVFALYAGWNQYRNSDQTQTLGEAFGIEQRGRGRRPRPAIRATEDQHRGFALEIAWALKTGEARKVKDAREQVAQRWGIGEDKVRIAWHRWRAEALSAVNKMG